MDNFKELLVWQKGMELTKSVYMLTRTFPQSEQFGLSSQLQRAAVAIPSNIAEGWRRKSSKEYVQYLHIAFGSCAEVETQLLIVKAVYSETDVASLLTIVEELQKMLHAMIKKIGS